MTNRYCNLFRLVGSVEIPLDRLVDTEYARDTTDGLHRETPKHDWLVDCTVGASEKVRLKQSWERPSDRSKPRYLYNYCTSLPNTILPYSTASKLPASPSHWLPAHQPSRLYHKVFDASLWSSIQTTTVGTN